MVCEGTSDAAPYMSGSPALLLNKMGGFMVCRLQS